MNQLPEAQENQHLPMNDDFYHIVLFTGILVSMTREPVTWTTDSYRLTFTFNISAGVWQC